MIGRPMSMRRRNASIAIYGARERWGPTFRDHLDIRISPMIDFAFKRLWFAILPVTALVLAASVFPSAAEARLGGGWGGSVVVLDASSGTVVREIIEPTMLAPLTFELNSTKKIFRATWEDVVIDSRGVKFTDVDGLGIPKARRRRELQFKVPEFSTAIVKIAGRWENAEIPPRPSYGVEQGQAKRPPPLPVNWNPENEDLIIGSDRIFISRGGDRVDCFDRKSGKQLWSLDLNPKGAILPGSALRVAILEQDSVLLVVTDRLGLKSVSKNSGQVLWHIKYSNPEIIPIVARLQNRLIVGPISNLGMDPY